MQGMRALFNDGKGNIVIMKTSDEAGGLKLLEYLVAEYGMKKENADKFGISWVDEKNNEDIDSVPPVLLYIPKDSDPLEVSQFLKEGNIITGLENDDETVSLVYNDWSEDCYNRANEAFNEILAYLSEIESPDMMAIITPNGFQEIFAKLGQSSRTGLSGAKDKAGDFIWKPMNDDCLMANTESRMIFQSIEELQSLKKTVRKGASFVLLADIERYNLWAEHPHGIFTIDGMKVTITIVGEIAKRAKVKFSRAGLFRAIRATKGFDELIVAASLSANTNKVFDGVIENVFATLFFYNNKIGNKKGLQMDLMKRVTGTNIKLQVAPWAFCSAFERGLQSSLCKANYRLTEVQEFIQVRARIQYSMLTAGMSTEEIEASGTRQNNIRERLES
jgi:hypothetical protein